MLTLGVRDCHLLESDGTRHPVGSGGVTAKWFHASGDVVVAMGTPPRIARGGELCFCSENVELGNREVQDSPVVT